MEDFKQSSTVHSEMRTEHLAEIKNLQKVLDQKLRESGLYPNIADTDPEPLSLQYWTDMDIEFLNKEVSTLEIDIFNEHKIIALYHALKRKKTNME